MGKKQQGPAALVAVAAKLQEALGGLRAVKTASEELEAAFDSTRLSLNRVVVELLERYLDEVTLRLDPKQSQAWDDFRAVLEVVVNAVVIRLPVPVLRSTNPGLAKKVQRRIQMKTYQVSTSGGLAPKQAEAQRIAAIVMPVLKAAYDEAFVDLDAIYAAIKRATTPTEGWGNWIDVKTVAAPAGGPYGFEMEDEFAMERTLWTVYVNLAGRQPSAEIVRKHLTKSGNRATVVVRDPFIPDPRFSYEPLAGGEVLVVHEPYIETVVEQLAAGKSLDQAEQAAYRQHTGASGGIWAGFWNYGCGWSRQPDSLGVIPEGWLSLTTPSSSGSTLEPTLWRSVQRARWIAEKWCDTTHLFRRTGWDDERENPLFAEEPEVIVHRPETGNWVTLTQTVWIQGEGYRETEIARFQCAEGRVREEWE